MVSLSNHERQRQMRFSSGDVRYGWGMPASGAVRSLTTRPGPPNASPRRRGRRAALPVVLLLLAMIALSMAGVQLPSRPIPVAAVPRVSVSRTSVIARFASITRPGQSPFLCVEPEGVVDVTDRAHNAVLRFSREGQLLSTWGPRISADVTLLDVAGVAARGGQWFVVDRASLRVIRLDGDGRPRGDIPLGSLQPYGPNGLVVDDRDNLYVADTGRNRVLTLGPTGRFIGSFGSEGKDLGQLKQPMALAVAPDGALFVADWENARIERWDGEAGSPGTWHATGEWATGFRPFGVAVDHLGRVYVPDMEGRRILVFTGDGAPLAELGPASMPTELDGPIQAAVGTDGSTLFVLGADALVRLELQDGAERVGFEPTKAD